MADSQDYQQYTAQIAQRRQELGQRMANLPNVESGLRNSIYGNDSVTNNLNAQEKSKIDELFQHDQNVATQYQQNPGLTTSPSGRVLDPYSRELALSNRYAGTAADLTTIRQGQQQRRDVLGDALQNSLKLVNSYLDLKKLELDQLEKDRDFAWSVYQFNHPKSSGGGSSGNLTELFNTILGLQKKKEAAAPATTYTTNRKIGKGVTKEQLLSDLKKKFPNQQLHLTFNKDGTVTASVFKPNQTILSPEEADILQNPNLFNQLGGASIAAGASPTDVSAIMKSLGIEDNTQKQTRGQQQDQAVTQLVDDLQKVPTGTAPAKLFVQLKGAYPEVADSVIKNLMNQAGFIIY